ncbi:uncharacterized protein [Danio rerio]|uniref:C-type lectin domain-containing protein n=1 Tax=Danio rerio TaxID=7955 RepID=A0A8M9PDT7_DANRE
MLAILLMASMFCQGLSLVSYGDSFITAFPENLGFFYPFPLWNILKVTALYDNTKITILRTNSQQDFTIQKSGQTLRVYVSNVEVNQLGFWDLSVRVTSDKNITLVSVSQRGMSTQVNVIQPIVNLGTDYWIPLLDYPGYLETFKLPSLVSTDMRYSSFKLLIINAVNSQNNIIVVKKTSTDVEEETFSIDPYKLVQLQTNGSVLRVKSSSKVAVILTHPCVETADCNCNMIMNQILPAELQGQSFIVPSVFNVTKTMLLFTSENASTYFQNGNQFQASPSALVAFSDLQVSQLVNVSDRVSIRLISPGLVVEMISENSFSACFLLQFNGPNGQAVVIAETDSKDQVSTDSGILQASEWTAIAGTIYSSTVVTIPVQYATIWHPTSKIAVYMLEQMAAKIFYGCLALPICEKPDLHGCVLAPGTYIIGPDLLNWTKSREYCVDNVNQFACPLSKSILKDMADTLSAGDGQGWIGLRRSLLTTEWYWQDEYASQTTLSFVHWDDGQPVDPSRGLRTSVSLDPTKGYKWKSGRCCDTKKPVCYKRPAYLIPTQDWLAMYI